MFTLIKMLVLVVSHSLICMEASRKEFTAHPCVLAVKEPIWCLNRFTPVADGLHMNLWGTWVKNTSAYVLSMEQKSLSKNSKYWLRERQICDRSWCELQHKSQTAKESQPLFWAFPYQYLEFLSKLFHSTLCTYAEVFSTHVPQTFMCNPSATGVNLFKHQIGSFTANTEGCTVNSFPPAFIHMGPWDTTNTNIFISVNIRYGWFNIWRSNLAQMWL